MNDKLPPGWLMVGGTISPGERIGDYMARGQKVKGTCRSEGCSRRIDLELESLVRLGMGGVYLKTVKALYRCHRLQGCGLDFYNEKPDHPIRLGHLTGRPNVRIKLRCDASPCKFARVWTAEEMIAGLQGRGQGGEHTEVEGLGAKMTTPCPVCKKVQWRASALAQDMNTIGWRSRGEGVFSDYSG